jgi:23S rRNA pseudouridine955/2504/2580 synthase
MDKKNIKIPRFENLILFEDENLLVVNKPPFLSCLEDRAELRNLLEMARGYNSEARLCHRIDKETSGIVLLAKNDESYKAVSLLFEKRKMHKIYHAITDGPHRFDDEVVDQAIYVGSRGKVVIDRSKGKRSVTTFNTLDVFRNHSLLECVPLTGRMHQIRIHLSTKSAAITGDEAYGGKFPMLSNYKRKYSAGKNHEEYPIIQRFALHAYALKFEWEGKEVEFVAPYPKDFEVLLKLLDKHNR